MNTVMEWDSIRFGWDFVFCFGVVGCKQVERPTANPYLVVRGSAVAAALPANLGGFMSEGITDADLAILEPEILKLFVDLAPDERMELLARMILSAESIKRDSKTLT